MSLQDDYFDLDASLKGRQRRMLRRIWKAFCEAENDAHEARDCVVLVNMARRYLADKPPLSLRKGRSSR
jgi:hypothetical protein